jgi:hypothetical protein
VDFADRMLVRFADPSTRDALFDGEALERVVRASYLVDAVDGPFSAIFEDVRVGAAFPAAATVEGTWQGPDGPPTRARFTLTGLPGSASDGAAATWTGAVVARTHTADAPITTVDISRSRVAGIDADIVTALGALPADPAALETERRARLAARIAADLKQPDAVGDSLVARWLARLGATSMAEVMAGLEHGTVAVEAVQVAFAPAPGAPPTPLPFPVAGALLVADSPIPVASLLARSDAVRRHLADHGLQRPSVPGLERRVDITVVWIVPITAFEDNDWPGGGSGSATARRARRIAAAGEWFAAEGVALVPVTPS